MSDYIEEIKKLKELCDEKIITEEEFNKKKAELLNLATSSENQNENNNIEIYSNNTTSTTKEQSSSDTLKTVAKVFAIISCVASGFYILPLAWYLPMTINLCKKIDRKQPISTGFKVCTLIFINLIAGILLLCAKEDKINK